MARALLVAERPAGGAASDAGFMRAKIATARFYAEHILSQAPGAARQHRRRRRQRHRAWRSRRSDASGVRTRNPMPLPAVLRNLPLPIIGAPLFIVSNPKLVIAQCKAGVVGSMPALNARPAEQLDEWLAEITETLAAHDRAHPEQPAAPFAINQIVHKSNDRLEHDMAGRAPSTRCRSSSPRSARAPTSTTRCTAGAASCCTTSSTTRFAQQGDREGRRRPDRGGRRRRRPCRREEPVRAGAGDPRVVRRPARAVGRDRHRRRRAGRAGDGRRLRLHRLGLHRHRRGARRRGLQADDRRRHAATTSSTRACSPACTATT